MRLRRLSLLLLIPLGACRVEPPPGAFTAAVGQIAAPVAVKGWVKNPPPGAASLDFSAFKGKVVLLERWATWCGPCVAKIPELVDLQAKHAGELVVVSLSQETAEQVQEYFRTTTLAMLEKGRPETKLADAINYSAAVMDPADPSVDVYFGRLRGVPSFYVIGRDGRVARAVVGSYDEVLKEVAAQLRGSRTASEEREAREMTALVHEKGRLTKETTKLGSPKDPALRKAALEKTLRLVEIAELELARRPWEFDARNDRLLALDSAWDLAGPAERPAVAKRIAVARGELFAHYASTRTVPLSWSMFAESLLPSDYSRMDATLALAAADRALRPTKASDGDRVWDMVHASVARVYLMNGRGKEAVAFAEKAEAEAPALRRGMMRASAAYHRRLSAMGADLAGQRASARRRLEAAAPLSPEPAGVSAVRSGVEALVAKKGEGAVGAPLEAYYASAAKARPGDRAYRLGLASLLLEDWTPSFPDPVLALVLLEDLGDSDPGALYWLAELDFRRGDVAGSLKRIEAALAASPGDELKARLEAARVHHRALLGP